MTVEASSPTAPQDPPAWWPEESVRRQVWRLLAGMYPGNLPDRRVDQRFPYPHLIHLLPVAGENLEPVAEPLVVVGKHLSQCGLGFYHPQPLTHRYVIASLETQDHRWLGFLVDIAWCRFSRQGWYDSGGRFLSVVPSPLAAGESGEQPQQVIRELSR